MKKRLLLPVLTLGVVQLYAQQRTVTGVVRDNNGGAISGASVQVKGTTVGTLTDADGRFTISVPANGRTLVISSVNFSTQEVAIGSNSNFTVNLQTATAEIDEVVVVGYQIRRKRDEAGAISSVGSKLIENRPNVSLDRALQGAAAGVQVNANNGIPGGAISVRIRGVGSFLSGNEPLYVIDGVQVNTRNDGSFTQSNPLSALNPNDIESIDVLKDAASAAIYGSQASNGVVLITTKKGKAGRPRVNVNAYVGQVKPLRKLDVVNSQQLYALRLESVARANNLAPNALAVKRSVLGEFRVPGAGAFSDAQADSAGVSLPTYDWQDAAFRTGTVQNYDVNVSGGNDRTTYRFSAGYTDQETFVTRADFQRANAKFDLMTKLNNWFTMSTSINMSTSNQQAPFSIEGSTLGNPAFAAAGIWPINPFRNADGSYFGIPINTPANLAGVLNQNILATNDFNSGNQRTNQALGNITFDVKLASWLTFRSFYGLDYRFVQSRRVTDPRTADGFARRGLTQAATNWNTNFNTYQTLNFNHTIGTKHRVDGLVGYEFRRDVNQGLNASADGFPSFQFTFLNNAANSVGYGEFFTGYKRNGLFGNFNYNYDRRYSLGIVARYDGSSRFPKGNRYGFFYGVKGAWNIDEEGFLKNNRAVTTLRLRASYGNTGNDQIGNFDALGLFGGGGIYNGTPGINYTQLANPDLKWENNATTNLGLDFGFFGNRLTGAVEVYERRTTDLLIGRPISNITGFSSITQNLGAMENRGVELTLGGDIIRTQRGARDGFVWNGQFNISYNENEVTQLFDGLTKITPQAGINAPANFPAGGWIEVGQPFGVLFTQRYAGVHPATGRAMFYDVNGNLAYQVTANDRVLDGGRNLLIPKYQGGYRNTFSWKGFTLEAFFQYEYGRWESDGQVNFLLENITRINPLTAVFDNRWTTPGQITSFPRMNTVAEAKNSGALGGDRTFFKADYIRLKTLLASYDLGPNALRKLGISAARFYVQGTNLATWSDWYSYDVEFNRTGTGAATGIIPQSKNVIVGVQVGF